MKNTFFQISVLSVLMIFNSCENFVEPPLTTSVSFKINRAGSDNNSLLEKAEAVELKIICIDATKYPDESTFMDDLISSLNETIKLNPEEFPNGQVDNIDSVDYDSWKFFFEKKVSGDFIKEFEESIDLSVESSKEIYVKPGLNYFLFFLMENDVTSEKASISANIIENEKNEIQVDLQSIEENFYFSFKEDGNSISLSGFNSFFNNARDIFYIRGNDSSVVMLIKLTDIHGPDTYLMENYFDSTKSSVFWRSRDTLEYCTSDQPFQGEVKINKMNSFFVEGSFSFMAGRIDSLGKRKIEPNSIQNFAPFVNITEGLFRVKIDK